MALTWSPAHSLLQGLHRPTLLVKLACVLIFLCRILAPSRPPIRFEGGRLSAIRLELVSRPLRLLISIPFPLFAVVVQMCWLFSIFSLLY